MQQKYIKGLDLSREFYKHCRAILFDAVPQVMEQAAIGLVGEGSECFGMDDVFSGDHDHGPAFCIWLPKNTLQNCEAALETAINRLPREFAGLPTRMVVNRRHGRVGPIAIEDFYAFFTGLERAPKDWREWLGLKENNLAAATNGEIFVDPLRIFSDWRQRLLDYYPDEVWFKKLAGSAMRTAQSGQYNLPRSLRRGDGPAAMLAAARFAEAALNLVFLLNRRYAPFYKWAPKMCRALPVLGEETTVILNELAAHPLRGQADMVICEAVEDYCTMVAAHLNASGLSAERDSWLWAHGPAIMTKVRNRDLLQLNLLAD